MVYSLLLTAGVGQRMRNSGLPKQFLRMYGKPIIIHALEKFYHMVEIDKHVVICRQEYIDYMQQLLHDYHMEENTYVCGGGENRQLSVCKGLKFLTELRAKDNDILIIHDGVRPLVSESVLAENIRIAREYGCAATVHAVTESVVVTENEMAVMDDFYPRSATYALTSPQTFRFGDLSTIYSTEKFREKFHDMPLLDAAMLYASYGGKIHLVKEYNKNLKITTPEDVYCLKAILEMEENKAVWGI